MKNETQELKDQGWGEEGRIGRMLLATYVPDNGQAAGWSGSSQYYIWKYRGTDVADISGGVRVHQDANFIVYRMAELMLMKAQALTMEGSGSWVEALSLINRIRQRAGLTPLNGNGDGFQRPLTPSSLRGGVNYGNGNGNDNGN